MKLIRVGADFINLNHVYRFDLERKRDRVKVHLHLSKADSTRVITVGHPKSQKLHEWLQSQDSDFLDD
jgi:hypothetical protein